MWFKIIRFCFFIFVLFLDKRLTRLQSHERKKLTLLFSSSSSSPFNHLMYECRLSFLFLIINFYYFIIEEREMRPRYLTLSIFFFRSSTVFFSCTLLKKFRKIHFWQCLACLIHLITTLNYIKAQISNHVNLITGEERLIDYHPRMGKTMEKCAQKACFNDLSFFFHVLLFCVLFHFFFHY